MSRKKTKQRTSDATTRRRVLWAGIALVLAIGICVAVYEMYALNQNPIRTVTALEETVYDTIDTTGFMLRAEQCLDVDLSGYTVPFIQDGERVPAGAEIAARFADAGSAQRYAQALQLRAEYDRYAALSAGTEYSSMKVEALMEKARLGVCDYLQAVAAGKIADAAAYESDFLDKETALEIAVSGSLDLSAKLAELSKKIEAQDASVGTYETLTTGADAGGYFFSETDGFEDTLSYADAEHLTVEQLEKAMAAEPASSKGGKIVKNHVWYITAILDAHDAESLAAVKGKVRIRFPQVGAEDVQATLIVSEQGTITATLKNGNATLCMTDVWFTMQDSRGDVLPLGSNLLRLPDLVPGDSTEVAFPVTVQPTASVTSHPITLSINYRTLNGPQTWSEQFTMPLTQTMRLENGGVQLAPSVLQGDVVSLNLPLMNMGKGELHNVLITLNLPPITEKQSVLVGTIAPSETKQGKISFTPGKTVLGDVQGSVTVTYEDAFGNAECFVLPVSTTVEEPKAYTPAADTEQEETLMILGMEWKLAAALGGCILLGCLLVLQGVLLHGKIRKMEEDRL